MRKHRAEYEARGPFEMARICAEFDEQEQEQRDKLLRKLLTTPPQPRPKRDRTGKAEEKPKDHK